MRRIVIGLGCLAAGMAIALMVVQMLRRDTAVEGGDSPSSGDQSVSVVSETGSPSLPSRAAPSGESGEPLRSGARGLAGLPSGSAVASAVEALSRPEAGPLRLTEAQHARVSELIEGAYRNVERPLAENRSRQRQVRGQLADPRADAASRQSLQSQLTGLVATDRRLTASADEAATAALRSVLSEAQMQQVDMALEAKAGPGSGAGGGRPMATPIQ